MTEADEERLILIGRLRAAQDANMALFEYGRTLPVGRPGSRKRARFAAIDEAAAVVHRTLTEGVS